MCRRVVFLKIKCNEHPTYDMIKSVEINIILYRQLLQYITVVSIIYQYNQFSEVVASKTSQYFMLNDNEFQNKSNYVYLKLTKV